MTLKEGMEGRFFKVCKMNLPEATERRLEVVGMMEGTPIEILNNKRKGAMIIKVRGTRFALGLKIANHITVEELNP